MAERRITEGAEGRGVVCFISNYSWLDGLSFTGMRERFLEVFDRIWIDCLNGDKYKTGKLTPEGQPDPSVFSTEKNREGIQVGTAIALARAHAGATSRRGRAASATSGARRSCRDAAWRDVAGASSGMPLCALELAWACPSCRPTVGDRLSRLAAAARAVCPVSFPGVQDESRRRSWSTSTVSALEQRMARVLRPGRAATRICASVPAAMEDTARFRARRDSAKLLAARLPARPHRPLLLPALRQPLALLGARDASCWTRSARTTSPHVFAGILCWCSQTERDRRVMPQHLRC